MKKLLLLLTLFIMTISMYAITVEGYIDVTGDLFHLQDSGTTGSINMSGLGGGLNTKLYLGNYFGIFTSADFDSINNIVFNANGYDDISFAKRNLDLNVSLSYLIGVTAKYDFNQNFQIYGGFGYHSNQSSFVYYWEDLPKITYLVNYSGIGGELGLRFVANHFTIGLGSKVAYDFYSKSDVSTIVSGETKTEGKCNNLISQAFISMGVRLGNSRSNTKVEK